MEEFTRGLDVAAQAFAQSQGRQDIQAQEASQLDLSWFEQEKQAPHRRQVAIQIESNQLQEELRTGTGRFARGAATLPRWIDNPNVTGSHGTLLTARELAARSQVLIYVLNSLWRSVCSGMMS